MRFCFQNTSTVKCKVVENLVVMHSCESLLIYLIFNKYQVIT